MSSPFFTPNLSNYTAFLLIPEVSIDSPNHKPRAGLQEGRKQRATSKHYTMIPILQEVTNFSSTMKLWIVGGWEKMVCLDANHWVWYCACMPKWGDIGYPSIHLAKICMQQAIHWTIYLKDLSRISDSTTNIHHVSSDNIVLVHTLYMFWTTTSCCVVMVFWTRQTLGVGSSGMCWRLWNLPVSEAFTFHFTLTVKKHISFPNNHNNLGSTSPKILKCKPINSSKYI